MVEYREVRRIFGDIADQKVAEIEASGVDTVELEKIAILLSGDTNHGLDIGHLSPKAQDLLVLLRRDDEVWEDDR